MTGSPDSAKPVTYIVDPTRLEQGCWSQRDNKTIGEGDIIASYSADRIGMGQPIRKPFTWQGSPWVCVAIRHGAITTAEAFRLTRAEMFNRQVVTYAEKTATGEASKASREDTNGFYDGVTVKYRGRGVLCGPPALFIPAPKEAEKLAQMDLFGADVPSASKSNSKALPGPAGTT